MTDTATDDSLASQCVTLFENNSAKLKQLDTSETNCVPLGISPHERKGSYNINWGKDPDLAQAQKRRDTFRAIVGMPIGVKINDTKEFIDKMATNEALRKPLLQGLLGILEAENAELNALEQKHVRLQRFMQSKGCYYRVLGIPALSRRRACELKTAQLTHLLQMPGVCIHYF